MKSTRNTAVAAALMTLAMAGTAQAQRAFGSGLPINGVSCDAMEGQRLHIHQHLLIQAHGQTVPIPPNVGQVPQQQCLYWIHTHTPDGIIHIEAPKDRTFTLGDFFDIWGQPLTKTRAAAAVVQKKGESLKVWLNGKPFNGDPRTIPLTAHADIVIQAGPPFGKVKAFTDWRGQ